MAEPWDEMFAESGLPADEYAGVRAALDELRATALPEPVPSEQVSALLAGGEQPRQRSRWLPAALVVAVVTGGGISTAAALGALPDPVQKLMHEMSDAMLPFEFPEPDSPVDELRPAPPATPADPPSTVPDGDSAPSVRNAPGAPPAVPPGTAPSGPSLAVPPGAAEVAGGPAASAPSMPPSGAVTPEVVTPGALPTDRLPPVGVPTSALPTARPSSPPTADVDLLQAPVDTPDAPTHPTRSPGQPSGHP